MSLQLNGTAGVTYNDGSNQPAAASPYGLKNLIINGDMRIAQRATSFASLTTTGYRTVDRYYTSLSSIGTWTQTQSTDAPDGFANSLKMECTTADASPAATDYLIIQHRIEGQNLQHLKKGTANAESLTLSFWVKCNQTGNLQVNLRDFDNSRQIGNTYTINSANTWEKKTITFTGDTTGTLDNDNSASFSLEWWLDSGSNYNSGSVPTSWQTYNDTNRNAGATINLADSTSNYINITGVQLEIGDTATPFENRMYGTELALCQRYYWKMTGVQYSYVGMGFSESGFGNYYCKLPVTMRTNPTVSISNLKAFNGVSNPSITGVRSTYMTPDAGVVQYYHTASAGSVYGAFIDPSTGYADFSAEL